MKKKIFKIYNRFKKVNLDLNLENKWLVYEIKYYKVRKSNIRMEFS